MINNRQSGRRRGRGGQRPQNGPGRQDGGGNRIDNRARGNAAQLLEKYKTLARDAQTGGDRVMTEYYLQFADHYFRVLSESRARFEEQNPRRQRDDEDAEGNREELEAREDEGVEDDEPYRQPRRDYDRRPQREDRPRDDRPRQDEQRADYAQTGEGDERPRREFEPRAREDRPRNDRPREDRPRRERAERAPVSEANGHEAADEGNGFDASLLPPSFNTAPPAAADDEAPAPRRRGRPRKAVEGDATPAEG